MFIQTVFLYILIIIKKFEPSQITLLQYKKKIIIKVTYANIKFIS